ncbi:MAG: hypothetical protein U1A27_13985 [Phycisphaerae bacterium]
MSPQEFQVLTADLRARAALLPATQGAVVERALADVQARLFDGSVEPSRVRARLLLTAIGISLTQAECRSGPTRH